MIRITILTLFPGMFQSPFSESIVARAKTKHIVDIAIINMRDFAMDRYKTVDDHPYGGGPGMVLRVDIIDRALKYAKQSFNQQNTHTILLDPRGTSLTQRKVEKLTSRKHVILICGHYEGVDERVTSLVDERLSIGSYILSGGEIAAMVVVDSMVRLLPGALGNSKSPVTESFSGSLHTKEYPQYTRPPVYDDLRVPDILLQGNHRAIASWRLRNQRKKPSA